MNMIPARHGWSLLTAVLSLGASGCSLIFVKGPPEHPVTNRPPNCTHSPLAPILDLVGGGLEVTRTAIAIQADDAKYEGASISRGADIGLGVGFSALFIGSAVYGLATTSACGAAGKRLRHDPTEGFDFLNEPPANDNGMPPNEAPRPPPPPPPGETAAVPPTTPPPTPDANRP